MGADISMWALHHVHSGGKLNIEDPDLYEHTIVQRIEIIKTYDGYSLIYLSLSP